jgi:hypothetical protein
VSRDTLLSLGRHPSQWPYGSVWFAHPAALRERVFAIWEERGRQSCCMRTAYATLKIRASSSVYLSVSLDQLENAPHERKHLLFAGAAIMQAALPENRN